jgi:hypothetical protein
MSMGKMAKYKMVIGQNVHGENGIMRNANTVVSMVKMEKSNEPSKL